jgi:hypothetical protein
MTLRTRFMLVYAALTVIGVAAGAGAYLGATRLHAPPRPPHCWVSGPNVGRALYSAAYCRFGRENVVQLGWMPHITRDGSPSRSLEEVMLIGRGDARSYWLARVAAHERGYEIRAWTVCGAVC